MDESGVSLEKGQYRSDIWEKKLTGAIDNLFGLGKQGIYLTGAEEFEITDDTLKANLEGLLTVNLEYIKARRDQQGLPAARFESFSKFLIPSKEPTQLEFDKAENELEIALGVVRGERSDYEHLSKIVGGWGGSLTQQALTEKNERIKDAPNVGFWGLGGKDPGIVRDTENHFKSLSQRIESVTGRVMELAPVWARKEV
jgi:hypothetical protein